MLSGVKGLLVCALCLGATGCGGHHPAQPGGLRPPERIGRASVATSHTACHGSREAITPLQLYADQSHDRRARALVRAVIHALASTPAGS